MKLVTIVTLYRFNEIKKLSTHHRVKNDKVSKYIIFVTKRGSTNIMRKIIH